MGLKLKRKKKGTAHEERQPLRAERGDGKTRNRKTRTEHLRVSRVHSINSVGFQKEQKERKR